MRREGFGIHGVRCAGSVQRGGRKFAPCDRRHVRISRQHTRQIAHGLASFG